MSDTAAVIASLVNHTYAATQYLSALSPDVQMDTGNSSKFTAKPWM